MKRKVNSVGTGTLTMSLPIDWVKKQKIKKGDDLSVRERNRSLIISMDEIKDEVGKKNVDLRGLVSSLKKILSSYYKAGYDELVILYDGSEQFDKIQKLLQITCIGYEITKIGKKQLVIREVSKQVAEEFDDMFQRAFFLVVSNAEEIYEAFADNNKDALKSMLFRYWLVNRYCDFCRRLLIKKQSGFDKAGPKFALVELLEKTADRYRVMVREMLKFNVESTPVLLKLMKRTNNYLRQCRKLYCKFDLKSFDDFITEKRDFFNQSPTHMNMKRNDFVVLLHCNSIMRQVFDYNGPMSVLRA